MSASVFNFAEQRAKRVVSAPAIASENTMPVAAKSRKPLSENAARREAWRYAERLVTFARAKLDLWHSVSSLEYYGHPVPLAKMFAAALRAHTEGELIDFALPGEWRDAVAKQLRTPAYDPVCVKWKQARLREVSQAPQLWSISVEEIERAIAADVAYLASKPKRGGAK